MKRLMIKTLLATAAVLALGLASAQDIKERTLKMGLQNPKGHPAVMGAEKPSTPPGRAARSRSTCSPAACWAATRRRSRRCRAARWK
jgi:hypothetical protein